MNRMKSMTLVFAILMFCSIRGMAQDLPDGPGKAEVETQCSACHSLARVVNHRDTLEGWRSIVDNMVGMGAMFTDDDKELIVNYLFKSFPDKPADAPAAAAKPAAPASTPGNASVAANVDASKVEIGRAHV
mgnify:CR=1 FL=1